MIKFKEFLLENFLPNKVKFFISKYKGTKTTKTLLNLVKLEYNDERKIIKNSKNKTKDQLLAMNEIVNNKGYKEVIKYLTKTDGVISSNGLYIIEKSKIKFNKNKIWYRSEGANNKQNHNIVYFAQNKEGAEYFDDGNNNVKKYKIDVKNIATVNEVKRLKDKTGNNINPFRKSSVSYLEDAEMELLKKEGFDAVYGTIDGLPGQSEIAIFNKKYKEI